MGSVSANLPPLRTWWNVSVTRESRLGMVSWSFSGTLWKILSHLTCGPQLSSRKAAVCLHVSAAFSCPFHSLVLCCIFACLCFYRWFRCFEWLPSVALVCCQGFLSARRLWCARWRKLVCSMSFVQDYSVQSYSYILYIIVYLFRYSAVGCEFNVTLAKIWYIWKKKKKRKRKSSDLYVRPVWKVLK